jgi:hypothetical protein
MVIFRLRTFDSQVRTIIAAIYLSGNLSKNIFIFLKFALDKTKKA